MEKEKTEELRKKPKQNKAQNMRTVEPVHPQGTWQQITGIERKSLPVMKDRPIAGVGPDSDTKPDIPDPFKPGVDEIRVREFNKELKDYRAGKRSLEQRVVDAERWWKMRNSFMIDKELGKREREDQFEAASAWLHNVITSKHADAIEAYPHPNILPREEGDKVEAWALSHIVPVIMQQNNFEQTYDHTMWQKLKTGTGVYMVVWDNTKLNGIGDISIKRCNLLNVFWEPGVNDIQDSRLFFHVASEDKDILRRQYPQLDNMHAMQSSITPTKMPRDDHSNTTNKVDVVDVYYKGKSAEGKDILHFCKYVGETVLYATENDPERAETGLYDHGKYPFVFDTLFPIEDSPAGYGYIDICANPQIRIDMMNTAFIKNTMVGAIPRYFQRMDGSINEEEFLDLGNPIIHVSGNLGEDSLRAVDYKPLAGNYINMLDSTINELRETSSNTETSTGSSTKGVTAASALAALQEASGKVSRASTIGSHRAYKDVVFFVIELIRQFYAMPRQFRITGNMGVQKFISFSNMGMQPQSMGMIGGVDLGIRTPIYDIEVAPEKRSSYTRLAQNELALQFYQMGFFNPQMADQALTCLDMMDFDGKDELMQKIAQNGTMFHQLQLYQAFAATLAAKAEPQLVPGLLNGRPQPMPKREGEKAELDKGSGEASHVARARERTQSVAQPGGSSA